MNTTGLYGPQLHTVQYVHNIQTVASPSSAKGSVSYVGIQNILGQCVSNITGTVAQDVQPLIIIVIYYLFRPLNTSVADQYHFDTDPDPGCEKFVWIQTEDYTDLDPDGGQKLCRSGSRSRQNRKMYQENKKNLIKTHIFHVLCVYIT